jgi:hypothetical protein
VDNQQGRLVELLTTFNDYSERKYIQVDGNGVNLKKVKI